MYVSFDKNTGLALLGNRMAVSMVCSQVFILHSLCLISPQLSYRNQDLEEAWGPFSTTSQVQTLK